MTLHPAHVRLRGAVAGRIRFAIRCGPIRYEQQAKVRDEGLRSDRQPKGARTEWKG
jgi:hypothetical protein